MSHKLPGRLPLPLLPVTVNLNFSSPPEAWMTASSSAFSDLRFFEVSDLVCAFLCFSEKKLLEHFLLFVHCLLLPGIFLTNSAFFSFSVCLSASFLAF